MVEKKKELRFNQDIELQKIQVIEEYLQTKSNNEYSIITTGFIGILIFSATIYIQGVFNIFEEFYLNLISYFFLFLAMLLVFIQKLYNTGKSQDRKVRRLSDLLIEVEEGKKLKSIPELIEELKAL